jgi:hypothetical protein
MRVSLTLDGVNNLKFSLSTIARIYVLFHKFSNKKTVAYCAVEFVRSRVVAGLGTSLTTTNSPDN